MTKQHLHATIRGRVQMVGFRYFVLGHAQRLGLTGWVRNGADKPVLQSDVPDDLAREVVRSILS